MAGGGAGGMASAGGGTVGAGMAEELVAEEVAASLESAGAGGASCMPLIGHVQFLNVVGQVGGSNGSKRWEHSPQALVGQTAIFRPFSHGDAQTQARKH